MMISIISQKIFLQMIHVGKIKVWHGNILQNLVLRLSKICKICDNNTTRKFPGIWYNVDTFSLRYRLYLVKVILVFTQSLLLTRNWIN